MEIRKTTAFGFEISILRKDDKFPLGLPEIGGATMEIHPRGYLDKKNKDVARRLRRDDFEVQSSIETEYLPLLNDMHARFGDLLDDYDREVILPSTTALGLIKPSHTDLDEIGTLGLQNDFEYSPGTISAVSKFYRRFIPKQKEFKLSLPRGKNTAYPLIVSGMMREANDTALAIQASLAIGAKRKGWSAKELTEFLARYHGPVFTVYGERFQHTPKPMPMSLASGMYYSHNVESRARGIYMSPKYLVAYNRVTVKNALHTFLNCPVHVQDRPTIRKRIGAAFGKNWLVLALDYSKFDQRAGGKRGRQVIKMIADVWNVDTKEEDLLTEFNSRLITFRQGKCYQNDQAPILMSGASFTSIVGGCVNVLSATESLAKFRRMTPDDLWSEYGRTWDYLAWGDDTLLMLDPKFYNTEEVLKSFEVVKMPLDEEPVVKYLGSVYGPGKTIKNVRLGYSLGRALQQQFLPERKKEFPFSTIGYIARLELMGEIGKEFHQRMLKKWDLTLMGEPFPYADRVSVVLRLLPEVEKYSAKMSQLDDVLQTLTHGLEIDDIDHLEFSQFEGLMGLSMADLTDPLKFLADKEVDPRIAEQLSKILKGDFSTYDRLLTHYTMAYNLQWRHGDVVY